MVRRVRTEFTGMQGTPYLSTMFFQTGVGTAQQLVNAVGTFWNAVDAQIDNELNWATLPDVETLDPATGQVVGVSSTTPATGTGGAAGTALPFATQGLVRWRTGIYFGGREVRGRTFIPCIVSTQNDNGTVLATYQTTVNAAAAALIADANSTLAVWSRKNGTAENVAVGSMWGQFAVLRSRRD